MAISKSLGLSSAKKAGAATSKAFRRLFGRVLPGGGPEGAAGTAGSRTGSSSFDSNKPSGGRDYSNSNTRSPNERSRDELKNNKDEDKEDAPKSETQIQDEQRQTLDRQLSSTDISDNKTQKTTETGTALDKMAVAPAKDTNKENQPPSSTALAESLGGLTLKETDEKPVAVEKAPELISQPIDEDPAVVAERVKNLEFIGEALDMVSSDLRNDSALHITNFHDKIICTCCAMRLL